MKQFGESESLFPTFWPHPPLADLYDLDVPEDVFEI